MSQSFEGGIIIPILGRIYQKYQECTYSKANVSHTECIPLEINLNLPLTYLIYF